MPQPTTYVRSYDFTDFQAQYPDQPLPASPLDSNFDLLGTSVNQVISRMALIQRDDGELKNQSVNFESLSNTVVALLGSAMDPKGDWLTATDYETMDLVEVSSVTYICVTDHTSGTFITDKDTSGYWLVFANPATQEGTSFFQKFSGTGAQTEFTVSADLSSDENAIMVFYDAGGGEGYNIVDPADITIDGTALTFTGFTPVSGTDNIFVFAPSLLLAAAGAAATAAEAAQAAAETAQTNAETAETNSTNSASASATSAALAADWAAKVNGIVDTTDYSSKAYAIGGTGVTDTATRGASKEWATKITGTVDTAEYAAKAYAIGGTGITNTAGKGAAKEWASKAEDSLVDTASYSALHYAAKAAATAAALGNVVIGPASSTANSFAVFDGATGVLLKDGGLSLTSDATNTRVGFGIAVPTHQQHTKLIADDNIFIDGRTNPRTITLGAMRQEHTAGIAGTRAFHIDINSAGYDDTSGIVMRHDLSGSSNIIRPKCMNLNADVTGATNAHLNFLEFAITGDLDPSMRADAIDIRHGVAPIHHHSGSTGGADTVFKYDDSGASYTDITTEAASTGSDVTLFDEVDDYVYWGNATVFGAIEAILATGAGNPGIKPTFEYSKGASVWETLSISDDTNGFRENGNIFWHEPSDWATDTVNAVASKYWVRIKRTTNTVTIPTEDTIKIVTDVEYGWDKDGEILSANVKKAKLDATTAPTANDDSGDGYEVGSPWIDITNDKFYICVDATLTAAIWLSLAALNAAQSFTKAQRASETTLTSSSASIAIDFADNNDFNHTLTENTTLANPSNVVIGQSGRIALTNHASSPKTLAFGSYYVFSGGTAITITASNGALDDLYYHVRSATEIVIAEKLDIS